MGIPVGSDIDYTDEFTMSKAMEGTTGHVTTPTSQLTNLRRWSVEGTSRAGPIDKRFEL
jgi:hypothetical protein